jgi:DNA-binding PadR family transcriptional regulator
MLNERERVILGVVEAGDGKRDARAIDLIIDAKIGPGEDTMLQELRALEERGLVEMSDRETGVGGRWKITEEGSSALASPP